MPVRARDAVVNDNEPGSVQKSAPRESQICVHIQLPFAVEISCPARNAESSPAYAPYFSRWTISNTNSEKYMIVLRCLLDVSGQFLGRPLSTLETSALRSDIIEIAALCDLFPAGV